MITDYDKLTRQREKINEVIISLEKGIMDEKNKITLYNMYILQKNEDYDHNALAAQVKVSEQNIELIRHTLNQEYEKIKVVDGQLKAAHEILKAHDTTPCLVGAAEHKWVMLEGRIDSSFKRRCSVCGTEQRVGHGR